jgi:hypothetical protein
MEPLLWLAHRAVLDWIVMDIIQMPLKLLFISYDVVPEAFLPEFHRA